MSRRTEYMRELRRKRAAWAIEHLGGKCVACGSTEKLELDHIERHTKEFMPVRRCGDVSLERFKAEVAKCQLLCNLCHIKKGQHEVRGLEFYITDPWDDESEFHELWDYLCS